MDWMDASANAKHHLLGSQVKRKLRHHAVNCAQHDSTCFVHICNAFWYLFVCCVFVFPFRSYISNPLLVQGRKFHIRVNVLAVGALQVFVHRASALVSTAALPFDASPGAMGNK